MVRIRPSGGQVGAARLPATDVEREQYVPGRLADAALRAAFVPADPVLSSFAYDPTTGNLLSYQEDGVTITLTYNTDGTVATSKRGANGRTAFR